MKKGPEPLRSLTGDFGRGAVAEASNGFELEPRNLDLLGLRATRGPEPSLPPADAAASLPPGQRGRFSTRSIIGVDDRVPVAEAHLYPWRAICQLDITAGDGSQFVGTGFLAGPNLVLTAGHCVFMHRHGGWIRRVVVSPGVNGPQTAPAHEPVPAITWRTVHGWLQGGSDNQDYGALFLDRNGDGASVGDRLGYFWLAAVDDAALAGASLNLAGYPADKQPATMWWQANRSARALDSLFTYTIDTYEGQSGAPVWRELDGRREVVGVHFGGGIDRNHAVRLTPPVLATISGWRSESA